MRNTKSLNVQEFEHLEKHFDVYFNYMQKYYQVHKNELDLWGLDKTKKLVDTFVKERKMGKLKLLIKEVDTDMRDGLPMKVANQIRNLYHTQLGEDIEAEEKKYLEKIEKIRKRGKIKTEAEYRLIETRLDELFLENPEGEAWQEMDKLLGTFDL